MTVTPPETGGPGPPEGEASREARESGEAPRARRFASWRLPLLPAALTLAVTLIGIGTPSLWLDESATISMTSRSYGDMLGAFHNLDLVHALYYMIMKPWVMVFGTSELAMRLPSAFAMAVAAAGVTVIGRRCLGTSAGLLAGLAWAVGPQTTRWAQEARSYAPTAAAAVLATYLFMRAVDRAVDGDERRRWPWFAGYALVVAVLGFLHLHGSLLLAAHGVTLLLIQPKIGIWVRWLVSAGVAVAPLVPFALAAQDQKRLIEWLPKPSWDVVWTEIQFLSGNRALVAPVVTLIVIGVVAGVRAHGRDSLAVLALPWLVLPSVLMLVASLVGDPVFYFRYTTFCLPAAALLVGAGLARVLAAARRRVNKAAVMAVATVALVAPSIHDHVYIREQDSRPENMRKAADVIRAHARPGDAIVYLAGVVRWSAAAYPDVFGRLDDVSLRMDPVTAANLKGRDAYPRSLPPKLAHRDRVWLMNHRALDPHGPIIERRARAVQAAGPWRAAGTWTYRGGWLVLYVRMGPYRSSR